MTGRKGKRMFRRMLRDAEMLIRILGDWETLNSRLRVVERTLNLMFKAGVGDWYQYGKEGTADCNLPKLAEARSAIVAEEHGIQATKVNR